MTKTTWFVIIDVSVLDISQCYVIDVGLLSGFEKDLDHSLY